jgi:hypothetical protein
MLMAGKKCKGETRDGKSEASTSARERNKRKKKRAEYMKQYRNRNTLEKRKEFSDSSDNDREDARPTSEDVLEAINALAKSESSSGPTKKWTSRPPMWRQIAYYFAVYNNIVSTISCYEDDLSYMDSINSRRTTIYRCKRDLLCDGEKRHNNCGPAYTDSM